MNITYKAYNSLQLYRAAPSLHRHHPTAIGDSRYVYREISVLLYPDGIEVQLHSVSAARDEWSPVPPADRNAFKLGWKDGASEMGELLLRETPEVEARVRHIVATLRAQREKFLPVFAINQFEL